MTANVSIQATLNNSANNFVISWQLASGGGIIDSIAPTKPYGNPFQVNIPGLTPNVTYVITLWESTTTSPAGTIRNATNVIPSQTTTTLRADDYLEVDATPGLVSGTSAYVNTSYAGWGYEVEQVGVKVLYPQGAPNITDPDYAQDDTGGFHLINTGDTFPPNQKYVVRFLPQVAPIEASSQGIYSTGTIITAAIVLDATYLNQALKIKGAGSSVPITLMPLSSVSDYQCVYLFSAGGSHVSAPIICAGTDKIQRDTLASQLILNQNEQLRLFKADGFWNIDSLNWRGDRVGELIYKYTNSEFSYVPANGALLSRTTYARLFAWLNSGGVNSGSICSEAQWGHTTVVGGITYHDNWGKWTMGDGSTTFRVPYLLKDYIRPIDPANGRVPGDWQVLSVGSHFHYNGIADDKAPGAAENAFVYGQTTTDMSGDATGQLNTGAAGAIYQGLTGPAGGAENTPTNTSAYILISI